MTRPRSSMVALTTCTAVLTATLLGAAFAAPKAPEGEKQSLKKLAWLTGTWEGMVDKSKVEEFWLAPIGPMMVGIGRSTTGDRTDTCEFLRMVEKDGEITFFVIIGTPPEIPFRLTMLKEHEAVFENPQQNYPKKFSYRLESGGTVFIHVEGILDGKPTVDEYRLKKKN